MAMTAPVTRLRRREGGVDTADVRNARSSWCSAVLVFCTAARVSVLSPVSHVPGTLFCNDTTPLLTLEGGGGCECTVPHPHPTETPSLLHVGDGNAAKNKAVCRPVRWGTAEFAALQ